MSLPQPPILQDTQYISYRWLELFFSAWVFVAISVLLVVWALPHTIAARNIALYTGLIAALGWVAIARPQVSWKAFWPSICLLLVPLWVLFHWFFISELKEQQWQELSSTWLRVSAAVILGSIAGIMISQKPSRIIWAIASICLLPTLTFALYLHQVYVQHHWILPSGMFYEPFKGKFSGVYFMLCQGLVGFGFIYYALETKIPRARIWALLLGITLVLVSITDFIAARALNGILVSGLGLVLGLFALLFRGLVSDLGQKRPVAQRIKLLLGGLLTMAMIGIGLFAFWSYDQRYEGKLTNLKGDIQIATQIDKNQTWIRDGRPIPEPIDNNGRAINMSTYERVSWSIKGAQLIQENPLGNGISHMAFGHYMRSEYPKSWVVMTHSAWIDYALGLGLPGLFLVWAAIFGVIARSVCWDQKSTFRNPSPQGMPPAGGQFHAGIALWLIAGMACFWAVGEVSEREYIEHYFFLIALFGMALAPSRSTHLP